MENQLSGTWQLVAARKYNGEEWEESRDFVDGITWEFVLEYIGETKHVGTIIECVGKKKESFLPYIYDKEEDRVTVEVYDSGDSIYPTVDIYGVEFIKNDTQHILTMSYLADAHATNSLRQYILHSL